MLGDTAWHLAQIPPRIVYDPNGFAANLRPIEPSEDYAAAIKLMELTYAQLKDEGKYNTGYWRGKEIKAKARCPLCHMAVHSKRRILSPGQANRPRDRRTQAEIDQEDEDERFFRDMENGFVSWSPSAEAREKMPERVFLRPGVGVYIDKWYRAADAPCDVTWNTGEYCPDGPGRWPQPGVMVHGEIKVKEGVGTWFSDDPTTNPWGIWRKPGPTGRMQWYDPATPHTDKHTQLGVTWNSDLPRLDGYWEVVEMTEEEWQQQLASEERDRLRRDMMHCQSHPGKVVNKRFTCCNGYPFSPGCVQRKKHMPDVLNSSDLREHWKMLETPWSVRFPRDAVVMDCEMGINCRGEQELIRVSMLDYYSGEVLIDALVHPTVAMDSLNTRWSGVTWPMLRHAKLTGKCVFGRIQALERIFDFVGPTTTLILHGGRNDMIALRWVHKRIIDTQTLDRRLSGPNRLPCSLKALAKRRLGRSIQNGFGHDSLEDVIATRDLCHFYAQHLDFGGRKLADCFPSQGSDWRGPTFERQFFREWYDLCHIEI